MNFKNSNLYRTELIESISRVVNFDKLRNSSVMVTGATGLIGSYVVDLLQLFNEECDANISIYAIGRSEQRLCDRFKGDDNNLLTFVEHDVCNVLSIDIQVDYIIHAASNAFPASFTQDPVGTITSNILGTYSLLEYGRTHGLKRFLYVSSGEVYGQGDLSMEAFSEQYSGYVDPVQVRSCYPNAKRTAETLCSSYSKQYGIETVVVRPSHTYGPNATSRDNRANVQFVSNALRGEDIIMKSAGTQMRSYTYVADCVTALLSVLTSGQDQNAYNIANRGSRASIAQFAHEVAKQTGRKVIFEQPDAVALAERTPIAKQVLDSTKLEALGWDGAYTLSSGIHSTISILREL